MPFLTKKFITLYVSACALAAMYSGRMYNHTLYNQTFHNRMHSIMSFKITFTIHSTQENIQKNSFIIHCNCKYLLYKSFLIVTKSHSVHTNGFLIVTLTCICYVDRADYFIKFNTSKELFHNQQHKTLLKTCWAWIWVFTGLHAVYWALTPRFGWPLIHTHSNNLSLFLSTSIPQSYTTN